MSARFLMSAPFESFLETVLVEDGAEYGAPLILVCTECGEQLCQIEEADSLHILMVTVLAHDADECTRGASPSTEGPVPDNVVPLSSNKRKR